MTGALPRRSGRQPNVLLITSDEERYALPQPQGYVLPARQRLQERGVSFESYYVASAQCSSSRSVIYTGQHMPLTEIYDNDNMPYIRPLDPELGTLGSMMRVAGYYCAYQGKWHLSRAYKDPNDPRPTTDALEPYGFSEFNDWGDLDGGAWAGLKIDPVIAGQAVKWLRNRAPTFAEDQPWFLTVNFVNPHDVMSYDYGGRRLVAPPPNLAEAMVVRPPADVPLYSKVWDLQTPGTIGDDLSGAAPAVHEYAEAMETMFGPVPDEDAWRLGLNFYLNCTRDVDRSIDVVLDALAASGQADRTVVIFTSDHGEMAGSHGLRQKGNLVYDENFHVPLVICHPDVEGGGSTDALGSAVDLAPTLLDIAGVDGATVEERFPALHGHSLMPALSGETVREGVLTAVEIVTTLDNGYWRALGTPDGPERVQAGTLRPDWNKRGFLRGYTDHQYTFGRYFSPLTPNRPRGIEQLFADNDVVLYDRSTDPHEQVNLADDPGQRELIAEMSTKLESLIDAEIGVDNRAWITERPGLIGYPTGRADTTQLNARTQGAA
jgi:arylsulfatase